MAARFPCPRRSSAFDGGDGIEYGCGTEPPPGSQRSPGHLEQEENRLWRLALWFMVLLAVALAVLLWERLETVPYHLGAIAPGLLILAVLFAAYAYGRRREVSELKVLLKDLQDRVGVAPSERTARPAAARSSCGRNAASRS
mgnify:CR=1 FL=1